MAVIWMLFFSSYFPWIPLRVICRMLKFSRGWAWGLRGGGDGFLLGAEFCFVWAALSVLALSVEVRGVGRCWTAAGTYSEGVVVSLS